MTDNVILSVSEVSEIQILHYIQNDIKVCKAALAQNDKAEKQCYNNVGDGFYNLSGYTWLRSGNTASAAARVLASIGYWNDCYPFRTQAVRPATHKAVDNCYHA